MVVDKFGHTYISYSQGTAAPGDSMSQANSVFLRLDETSLAKGDINLDSHKFVNVYDPTDSQDAATKRYVDINSGGAAKVSKGGDTMEGVLNMNNFPLTGLLVGIMGTGSDAISWSDAIQLNDSKVNITGNTMTGNLFISADSPHDKVLGCTVLMQGKKFIILLGTNTNKLYFEFNRKFVVLETDCGFRVKSKGETIFQLGTNYDPNKIMFYKDIKMNLNRITNVPLPALPHEIANKMYVDSKPRKILQGYIPHLDNDKLGFFVTASSNINDFYQPGEWASQKEHRGFWIQIRCPDLVRLWRIGLRGKDNNNERIYNWRLEGSTNGETYTTLLEPPNPTYIGNEAQYFSVDTQDSCNIFRLYCLEDEPTNPGLSYFQLYVYSK